MFRPEYHKRIPADGYNMYASSIWDKVLTNKDLDLPTQQELLAQYRCDEISNVRIHITFTVSKLIILYVIIGCFSSVQGTD